MSKLMVQILLERAARRIREECERKRRPFEQDLADLNEIMERKGAPADPGRPRTKEKKHNRHSPPDEKMPVD